MQSALRTLLNLQDTCSIHPTSELFINDQLPAKEEFLQAMRVENYTVNQLQLQSQMPASSSASTRAATCRTSPYSASRPSMPTAYKAILSPRTI